jgi:AraC-like DNA-binding protein
MSDADPNERLDPVAERLSTILEAADDRQLFRSNPTTRAVVPCALHLESVPPAVYREYVPPSHLKPHLVCGWTLEIRAGDSPHRQKVLPDGCSDIVWIGEDSPIVVGPMTRSVLSTSRPGTTLVGLRFRPSVAGSVFGVPAYELTDRHIVLEDLWRRATVAEASNRLLERRTAAGRMGVALAFLASRQCKSLPHDQMVEQALALLSEAPHERVEALANVIGLSDRHLRRRFLSSVGYSPKRFQRILRFQRLLALAKGQNLARLGHVAMLAGYADQAHMNREIREFADAQPSALLGNVVSALTLSDLLSGATEKS